MASNSTFQHSAYLENPQGEMSIDGSPIEKVSPPDFVTLRKGLPPMLQDESAELQISMKEFQDNILSTMRSLFSKQDDRLSQIDANFLDLKTSLQFISDKYDTVVKKVEEVDERLDYLEDKVNSNMPQLERISQLESKIDDLEQQARQCNIEVGNLPEKRGENLVALLEKIGKAINFPVNLQDVIAVHRVPQKDPKSSRPKNVIVKLRTLRLRDDFLAAARQKKSLTTEELDVSGPVTNCYINEHLTLQNKKLFREAREAAKANGFKYVWVKHGAILARANESSKVFAIRSHGDISKIKRI